MTNLPAFSGQTIAAFMLADLLILFLFFIGFYPIFVLERDLFGRSVEVGVPAKIAATLLLIILLAYFALQTVVLSRFLPYEFDSGVMTTETVVARQMVTDSGGAPIAYWLSTADHRFGVTQEIYDAVAVGDTVTIRFRAVDDTLYEIHVVRHFNDAIPSPGAGSGVSPTEAPSSQTPEPSAAKPKSSPKH
jgi:hypothetical protein